MGSQCFLIQTQGLNSSCGGSGNYSQTLSNVSSVEFETQTVPAGQPFAGCSYDYLVVDGVSRYPSFDGGSATGLGTITEVDCGTGQPLPKYDSINGACIVSTTYSTPGHYTSMAACSAGIACPACPACPALPCASCPTGQTCKDSSGEEVNFVNISVPTFTGNCDDSGNPVFIDQSVAVIAGTESSELLKFQELAQIKGAAVCNIDAAACPDGWLIRPEYHRPQVIYQFAEVANTGKIVGAPKYKITVPHHLSDEPDDPLPNYKRGNWEIIYVLKDNSKVTIHSFDESNGMIMLNAIKLRITPSYLVGAYLSKSSLVVTDTPIAEITVKNRMAKYYSTGTKNGLPDWIVKW